MLATSFLWVRRSDRAHVTDEKPYAFQSAFGPVVQSAPVRSRVYDENACLAGGVIARPFTRSDGRRSITDHEFQQFAALLQPQHGVRGAFDVLNDTLSIHNHRGRALDHDIGSF